MGVFIDGKSLSHTFIFDSFDIAFDLKIFEYPFNLKKGATYFVLDV